MDHPDHAEIETNALASSARQAPHLEENRSSRLHFAQPLANIRRHDLLLAQMALRGPYGLRVGIARIADEMMRSVADETIPARHGLLSLVLVGGHFVTGRPNVGVFTVHVGTIGIDQFGVETLRFAIQIAVDRLHRRDGLVNVEMLR